MDRAAALESVQKATIETTTDSSGSLLSPSQSASLLQVIKDKGTLSPLIRQEVRTPATGTINKITSGSRLIRAAAENADDGYRAEVTFPTVPYTAKKIRLPWEVTEDEFHENIDGQALEAKITDEMTQQFALDLEDLDVNGDGTTGAFLSINEGLLYQADNTTGVHKVDGSQIDSGAVTKNTFFDGLKDMPNKYRNTGNLKWLMSPAKQIEWVSYLTDRETPAGDAALSNGQGLAQAPLGIPIVTVPSFPDTDVVLVDPKNLLRVMTWDVRKRKVTGETDWELATRDKRGYIFFVKYDFILAEPDAVVYIHDLDA